MTDQITAAELAEIEARAAAATEGPWVVSDPNEGSGHGPLWMVHNDAYVNPHLTEDEAEYGFGAIVELGSREDSAFIAAARTDVPRLVAALRAAYAQLRSYESAICFEVTCTGCAKQLDALATAEAERDQATAELAGVRSDAFVDAVEFLLEIGKRPGGECFKRAADALSRMDDFLPGWAEKGAGRG